MASKSSRSPIRKEVHNFLVAAERLLSRGARDPELTPEECHLICEYLITMSRAHHPWSSHLALTMSGHPPSATSGQSSSEEAQQ